MKNLSTLIALALGQLLAFWDAELLNLCLPFIKKELALSYTQIGFLSFAQVVCNGILVIPGGIISDLFGLRKTVLNFLLLWGGIIYFFAGFSTGYLMLLLILMFRPLWRILWDPASATIIVKNFADNKAFAFAFRSAGSSLGRVSASLIVGFFLGYTSWRIVFHLDIITGITVALLFLLLVPPLGGGSLRSKKEGGSFRDSLKKGILKNPQLIIVSVINFLRSGGQRTCRIFIPLWLGLELNFAPALIGLFISLFNVTSIPGRIVLGHLSDQMGRKPIIFIAFFLGGLSIYLFTVFETTVGLAIILGFLGIFVYCMQPTLMAFAMDTVSTEIVGSAHAFIEGTERVFAPLFLLVFGYLSDVLGLSLTFTILAIIFSLSAFSALLLSES